MGESDDLVKEEEVGDDYAASLTDLVVNSKPLINVLTILAEENKDYARIIVKKIEEHLEKVQGDAKLPTMYLIDSIMKNIGSHYVSLFSQNIDKFFARVFQQATEAVRTQMYKLRQTWTGILPARKLEALDKAVHEIDTGWPAATSMIYVNPKFLPATSGLSVPTSQQKTVPSTSLHIKNPVPLDLAQKEVLRKQKELQELQKKKQELEMEITQAKASLNEKPGTRTNTAPSLAKLVVEGKEGGKSESSSVKNRLLAAKILVEKTERKLKVKNSTMLQQMIESLKRVIGSIQGALDSPSKQTNTVIESLLSKLSELTKMIVDYERKVSSVPAVAATTTSTTSTALPSSANVDSSAAERPSVSLTSASSAPSMSTGVVCTTASSIQSIPSAPLVRIAPVSSELINAAQRVRDPRLRKMELSRLKNSSANAAAAAAAAASVFTVPSSTTTANSTAATATPSSASSSSQQHPQPAVVASSRILVAPSTGPIVGISDLKKNGLYSFSSVVTLVRLLLL